jgi:cyclase
MLSKRIIACLDVRNGQVVKGVNFEGLRNAGDPAELAERYNEEGIDEVVILDVTATIEGRRALAETVSAVARRIFIPLTVGGGIRSEADAAAAIDAGAEKVSPQHCRALRSGTHHQARFTLRQPGGQSWPSMPSGWMGARRLRRAAAKRHAREAVEWAREAADRGAGEILLTPSIATARRPDSTASSPRRCRKPSTSP